MTRHRRLTDIRRRVADLYFHQSNGRGSFLTDDEIVLHLAGIAETLGPRGFNPHFDEIDDDWRAYAVARDRLAKLAGRLAQRINGAPIRPMDAGPF
jgi:hypothetical protein